MSLILLVFAFVLFVLATTLWVPEPNRTRVISAGLAFWVAASFVAQFFVKG